MGYEREHAIAFIKGLATLTGLPIKKAQQYAKDNNLFNILEHPQTIAPNEKQLEKISLLNEFISSYNILKLYESQERLKLDASSKAGQYFLSIMGGMKDKERFMVAFLDNGNNIIETRTMSEGSIGEAVVYPREILKAAIASDCKGMILAHNHPGNSVNPSKQDIDLTQKVVNIFHPLDIKVMDHIIIGGNQYSSMAEKGYMPDSAIATASYQAIAMERDFSTEESLSSYSSEDMSHLHEEEFFQEDHCAIQVDDGEEWEL
jgi:DNA repair protein RadC